MACMTARATAPGGDPDGPGGDPDGPGGDPDGPGGDPGDPWPLDLIDECGLPAALHG
ncbi:hypothetical protein IBTHAUMO2_430003 [Nitrosopumilaceae archaeon]|nr:hypothetical protein IBTHAUMO2_430003 [Nitrosopumilaceae archaeon]